MNILSEEMLDEISYEEAPHIINQTDVLQETVKLAQKGLTLTGDCLPFEKTTQLFRFRPGEVTLWCGQGGSGKSILLSQTALWLTTYSKVLIASMEMPPPVTHYRMMRQASGCEQPTAQFIVDAAAKMGKSLWYYNQLDTVKSERIIGMIHWASTHLGIKHHMIDSMVMCGVKLDDYDAQRNFMAKLTWAAKKYDVHIHLVVHTRKAAQEHMMPDKYSIKGAGELADLASNILLIHRDKDPGVDEKGNAKPDGYVRVAKQRNGEFEGTWGFWWHPESMQWVTRPGRYIPWPNPEEHYH